MFPRPSARPSSTPTWKRCWQTWGSLTASKARRRPHPRRKSCRTRRSLGLQLSNPSAWSRCTTRTASLGNILMTPPSRHTPPGSIQSRSSTKMISTRRTCSTLAHTPATLLPRTRHPGSETTGSGLRRRQTPSHLSISVGEATGHPDPERNLNDVEVEPHADDGEDAMDMDHAPVEPQSWSGQGRGQIGNRQEACVHLDAAGRPDAATATSIKIILTRPPSDFVQRKPRPARGSRHPQGFRRARWRNIVRDPGCKRNLALSLFSG
ncbi:hypothetical protein VTI74DRAFT_11081 [Chaetomium olivicolor]